MINVAAVLREMHNPNKPLVLPNIWDAGSARIFEDAGAPVLATTSAGVCWALGYPDSDVLPVRKLVELTANIVRVIRLPLSVDVEEGYSDDPAEVAETVVRSPTPGPLASISRMAAARPKLLLPRSRPFVECLRRKALKCSSMPEQMFISAVSSMSRSGLVRQIAEPLSIVRREQMVYSCRH